MDLSEAWPYITQIAEHRLAHNKTERHVAEYGTYIEVIGAAGELAARRFLQTSEDLHEHFDGGADILYKDIRIDVKATVWTSKVMRRYLQWPVWKRVKADVILFTAVNQEKKTAMVMGYVLPNDIFEAPVNKKRDIPCHEIPVTNLRKASALLFAERKDDLYPGTKAQAGRTARHYRQGKAA